ncbi:frizzled-1-like [Clytia hemisphaerica]|uniref:FZ domain-containing protein n=1 Tax=Clytia hemisphaerica TaxID=252671 RepID=A0A7M5X242_9CNID
MSRMEWLAISILLCQCVSLTTSYRFIAMNQRRSPQCERVESLTCLTKVGEGYNSTMFPNHLGHSTQKEALAEMRDFEVLIESGCSKYLSTFLCSLYFPICTPGLMTTVKPCRNLCEKSKKGCAHIVQKYGYEWKFNCTQFPDPATSGEICVGATTVDANQVEDKSVAKKEKKTKKKARMAGGSENDILDITCPRNKYIFVRKVMHFGDSTCCKVASKAVLTALCNGKRHCKFTVAPESLGGHCEKGRTGQIMVRYRCTSHKDKNCSQQNAIPRKSRKNTS